MPLATRLILLAVAALWPRGAEACEVDGAAWTVLGMPGREATQFTCAGDTVAIEANTSVAFLYRATRPAEGTAARLAWRWRVDEAPPATDQSRAGGDDRPLAVHLIFPRASGGGLLGRLGDTMRQLVPGAPPSGRLLTYVWGGAEAPGTIMPNPYRTGDGYLVVLRNGAAPARSWLEENVDFRADYIRAFGGPAPDPVYVALSADTDDRGGRSRARVTMLRFAAAGP